MKLLKQYIALLTLILVVLGSTFVPQVRAADTVPLTLVYQGELYNSGGAPLTGDYYFRLSLWDSLDYVPTDTSGTSINVAAPNYLAWQELHLFTVDDGKFAIDIGSVTPFPNTDIFDENEIYLQVEIGLTPTTLELVDTRPETDIDRLKFFSMPYAFNADKLDWRDVGFGADDIPYLDGFGKLPETTIPTGTGAGDIVELDGFGLFPKSTIPGGTQQDGFTIDSDGNAATEVFLQFGSALADSIKLILASDVWDFAAKRITNILDPVDNQDAATKSYVDSVTTGAVNGTDNSLFELDQDGSAATTDTLTLRFGNGLGKDLSWDGTDDRFEFNDNVHVSGNFIVTGTINGITIGPKEFHMTYSPFYKDAVFVADGSDNVGAMHDGSQNVLGSEKNTLDWSSRSSTLQDYSIQIRHTLPQNFSEFITTGDPISISYTTEGLATDSKIDFTVTKEGSVVDEIDGDGVGLNNNTWTDTTFDMLGATSWNAGDVLLLNIKTYSKDENIAKVGDIVLKYMTE